ncbi:hypothetical protein LINPERPRIM_LOCUS17821 [Linum perenne]
MLCYFFIFCGCTL